MTTDLDRLIEAVEAGQWVPEPTNERHAVAQETDGWGNITYAQAAYHGDLNAAVVLLEALLPGWAIERMTSWPGRCCRVSLWGTHDLGGERWHSCEDGRIDAEGPTLARALLLATLRAYRNTREDK